MGVWKEEVLLADGRMVRWDPNCLTKKVLGLVNDTSGITLNSIHNHQLPQQNKTLRESIENTSQQVWWVALKSSIKCLLLINK